MSVPAGLDRTAADAASVRGGENFPVALRILPRGPRRDLTALYAYARWVDDLGDRAAGDRLALLAEVDRDLDRLAAGADPELPVLAAFAPVVRAHALPVRLLRDLVEANRVDQTVTRYPTWTDLRDYCRLSADPVGRLVLGIAGAVTPRRAELSDDVCTALQVLEHLQDVREDAEAGRVYLPAEDRAHVADADLTAATATPALRECVRFETDRAEDLLGSGTELVHGLRGWARLAVAGFVAGGLATVRALRDAGHDPLAAPVRPATKDTAIAALRLVAGR